MLSLISDEPARMGFNPEAPRLSVRICWADAQPVIVSPPCSARAIAWVLHEIEEVSWAGIGREDVVEVYLQYPSGVPDVLVNGEPDNDAAAEIMCSFGPVFGNLMQAMAKSVLFLPSAVEFENAVANAHAESLRAALLRGDARLIRANAHRVVPVCRSCGCLFDHEEHDGTDEEVIGIDARTNCGDPFAPFVAKVFWLAGATVLCRVADANLRRLLQDLMPTLVEL